MKEWLFLVLKNGDALEKSEFTVRIDEAPD